VRPKYPPAFLQVAASSHCPRCPIRRSIWSRGKSDLLHIRFERFSWNIHLHCAFHDVWET
jgi:hypothetical protein